MLQVLRIADLECCLGLRELRAEVFQEYRGQTVDPGVEQPARRRIPGTLASLLIRSQ
jgi:hypothetical protein